MSSNSTDDAVDQAVREGAEAAREGKPDKANPYGLEDTVLFGAWLAGWIGESSPRAAS